MKSGATVEPSAYRRMFAVEDAHWWFDGMEAITARLLDRWRRAATASSSGDGSPRVLDAGCGTGRNLRFLTARFGGAGQITGIDHSAVALGCCVQRGFGGRLARASVNALPFADGSFDLVTCFDVISAAAVDDRAALREFARVLRPGGVLLLRVAAYDWLRGRHDREWLVTRRFHRAGLRGELRAAGFGVDDLHLSYANAWLLPLAIAKRLVERLRPPASDSDLSLAAGPTSLTGRVLRAILTSEARLVAALPGGIPCGLSLFALARKSGDQ